jgi:hypothetical protein
MAGNGADRPREAELRRDARGKQQQAAANSGNAMADLSQCNALTQSTGFVRRTLK